MMLVVYGLGIGLRVAIMARGRRLICNLNHPCCTNPRFFAIMLYLQKSKVKNIISNLVKKIFARAANEFTAHTLITASPVKFGYTIQHALKATLCPNCPK